jgi:SAM-dependent methyltransferase
MGKSEKNNANMNDSDKWNQRYRSETYVYGKEPNDFLLEFADNIPPGKVLCLAEGEGRNAVYLASLGHRVVAVDSSSVGLEKAALLAKEKSVSIECVTVDLAEFDIKKETWDGIISIFCHLPKGLRQKIHNNVVDGLRPGGVFVLEAYTPHQLEFNTGGPKDVNLLYELESLVHELDGLVFIHAVETVREIYEGQLHFGKGSVVQIYAKKIGE